MIVCKFKTSSVDPDEMPHYAAFHIGIHCLSKYLFRVSSIQRVHMAYPVLFKAINKYIDLANGTGTTVCSEARFSSNDPNLSLSY